MSNRGNIFANIENKFEFATEAEIREMTMESAKECLYNYMHITGTDPNSVDPGTIIGILIKGATFGAMGDGYLSIKRMALIKYVFDDVFSDIDMDMVYDNVRHKISEEEHYEFVESFVCLGNDVAISFLHYVLGIAYIDGKLNDEVGARLETIYAANLILHFAESGLDEVPAPKVKLTKQEADVMNYLKKEDKLTTAKELYSNFSCIPNSQLENVLDNLCEKGLIQYTDAIIGGPHYLLYSNDDFYVYDDSNSDNSIEYKTKNTMQPQETKKNQRSKRNVQSEKTKQIKEEEQETKQKERSSEDLEKFKKIQEKYIVKNRQSTISAGLFHTIAVKSDGTVVSCGKNQEGECNVSSWKDVIAVSGGGSITAALKYDGTVIACGDDVHGSCGVEYWSGIVAISTCHTHTVGIRLDGTVAVTKYTGIDDFDRGQMNVLGWKDIVEVSVNPSHTIGLKSDGTVVATKCTDWDFNEGQCDVKDWKDIVAISTGNYHTIGLKSDGTVVATKYTGNYYDGECDVYGWGNIVAISAGTNHSVGLKSDGTVVACGTNEHGQCDVDDWTDIVAISAGAYHTVGLKSDGTVVATEFKGDNYSNSGQCNVGYWRNIMTPTNEITIEEFERKKKDFRRKRDEELKMELQMEKYRKAKLCQHCGGTFNGFLFKTCTKCGKKKDY